MTVVVPPRVKVPVQAPLLVQVGIVPVIVQVSVADSPAWIVVGFAFIVIVGATGITSIVTDFVSLPAVLVHVIVYVLVEVGFTTRVPPLVSDPVHAPVLVQVGVVPLIVQVNVELSPSRMVIGLALSETIGTACITSTVTDFVSLPTEFVHVML